MTMEAPVSSLSNSTCTPSVTSATSAAAKENSIDISSEKEPWDNSVKAYGVIGTTDVKALDGSDAGSGGVNITGTMAPKDAFIHNASCSVLCVAASAHGRFVSGGTDGYACVWNMEQRDEPEWRLQHLEAVCSVDLSADGSILVTGTTNGAISVWNLAKTDNEAPHCHLLNGGHHTAIQALSISPDGSSLISGSLDKYVCVWCMDTCALLRRLKLPERLHRHDPLRTLTTGVTALSYSPDAASIAVASRNATVHVFDTDTWQIRFRIVADHFFNSVSFSPDSNYLALAVSDGSAVVFSCSSEEVVSHLIRAHTAPTTAAVFSEDGARLCTAGADGRAHAWEWHSGNRILELSGSRKEPINDIVFLDSDMLAAALPSGALQILTCGLTAEEYAVAARRAFDARQWASAVALFNKEIAKEPSANAYSDRGWALMLLKRIDDAHADFLQAIALNRRDWKVWFRKGKLRRSLGDLDGAVEDFSESLSLDPSRAHVSMALGMTLMAQGLSHGQKAMDYMTEAIRLCPSCSDYYVNRAALHSLGLDAHAAIVDLDAALELNPSNLRAHMAKVNNLMFVNELEDALAAVDELLRLKPNSSFGLARRARIKLTMNRTNMSTAIEDLHACLELDGTNKDAKDILVMANELMQSSHHKTEHNSSLS